MASRMILTSILAAVLIMGFVSCQEDDASNAIIPEFSSQAPAIEPSTAASESDGPEVVTEAPSSPPGSTVFSRLIHDIFQIPIQVLKAVRNMLSNASQRHERPAAQ